MTSPLALLRTAADGFAEGFERLERRRAHAQRAVEQSVLPIVEDVRARGDAALIEHTLRLDGYKLEPARIALSAEERDAGRAGLTPDAAAALALAADRIREFHAQRVPSSWQIEREGERLGRRVQPLERVAIYVPSAKAPLASTVLMLAVPAAVAGVSEIVLATSSERPHPAILEAARLAGVSTIYRVGGPQVIAALAFGSASVRRVDKIVGPGSVYVQAAKRLVFGEVAIDAEAGPSELMIVADDSGDPSWLAADLLAQAEHDEMASVVLASPSDSLVRATLLELASQLARTPRRAICERSLRDHSAAVVTRDLAEAIALANRYAAEHVQLIVREPRVWVERIRHAGALFIGPHSPVPLGDYLAGPSHVLPTGGTARFSSALGVEDFVRNMSVLEFDAAALRRVAPAAVCLAELEGLTAHADAVRARLGEGPASVRTREERKA